ncbi:MAG: DUF11 domain-containing protein [Planctomycetaceae bacterium]|nr:DUF11 domain-containing protein [Planctomycetales bacterium]MCB9923977.1 DUF11 domain-containing protein [Planctomycetaceae bacterium]
MFEGLEQRRLLATFAVLTAADSGVGSLRQAILDANTSTGPDLISFNIPGSGVHTIQPQSALPTITDSVAIDGYTQPGATANTIANGDNAVIQIEIDGSQVGGSGLVLAADNNTVRGLAINNFAGAGIFLVYSDSNTIAGNFIGTDPTGTIARPNDLGIKILAAHDNMVGGLLPADRNILSGNKYDGINVQGTYNPTDWQSFGNQIVGNFAGTDASGTVALPNGSGGFDGYGINIGGGYGNLVANNVASGNGDGGIALGDYGTVLQGNYIGTDATGTLPLGNTGNTFYPQFGNGIYVYGVGNRIGGAGAGEGNLIAFNDGAGVYVSIHTQSYNGASISVRGNSIHSNGGLGIDLAPEATQARGVTPNDDGDADVGPNGYQNFPSILTALTSGGGTQISGSLNSTANTTFTLDFYANSAQDPSGNGEGATYLGAANVTTDGMGNVSFTVTVPGIAALGSFISATATDPSGNTSEFSGSGTTAFCSVPDPLVVTTDADVVANDCVTSLREAISYANSNAGLDTITFDIPGGGVHTIQPLSALPAITDAIVLDGYSQPGASVNTLADANNAVILIELDGTLAGLANGLKITAGNSTVRGLAINRFQYNGIGLESGSGNVIEGNYIGTDSTGTQDLGNGIGGSGGGDSTSARDYYGIRISLGSGSNRVGTNGDNVNDAAERNLISGNDGGDIAIIGTGSDYNVIAGNLIGTDRSGTLDLSVNTILTGEALGVMISNGARFNRIGTDGNEVADAIERNVISGHGAGGGGGSAFFSGIGVVLYATQDNVVAGNYVGTDVSGTSALPNFEGVLSFNGTGSNRIGTDENGSGDAAETNVVSGNLHGGIQLQNGIGDIVAGNYVGTDYLGTSAVSNQIGVVLSGAGSARIGGTTDAARNVISGNRSHGIDTQTGSKPGTIMQGNYIGVDGSGVTALSNGQNGINFGTNLGGLLVGGTANGAGNVISGNVGHGLLISNSTNVLVQGNSIGTDKTGTVNLGNQLMGIFVYLNASGTQIGGTTSGAANTIAFNVNDGVYVNAGIGHTIRGNSIHSNGGLGIDLSPDGVNGNDAGDGDIGANNRQNYPLVTSAHSYNGGTQIAGSLNSTPNTTFTLDFYANTAADPSGRGEGETYLGAATISTDANGDAVFAVNVPGIAAVGSFVSATATDPNGNTSEFSGDVVAVLFEPGTISGIKFHDLNGNGVRDTATTSSGTIVVPGTADPWLAGMPDGSLASSGDVAPDESPVLVPITIAPGSTLTFDVTGCVQFVPGGCVGDNPDGISGGAHATGAENGISNLAANWNSLIGVFLGPNQPNLSPAPSALDFSTAASRDYLTLSPFLQQTFFIGNGRTSTNQVQQIIAPAGATRLFLGTMDGSGWYNNSGTFSVEVTQTIAEPVIPGWTIQLDAGADGSFESSATTDANGTYTFNELRPDTYRVREVQQPGWTQTSLDPADIVVSASGQMFAGVDFGNRETAGGATISGTKFLDINKDGLRGGAENVLNGWVIYLDSNNDGVRDPGEPFRITGGFGNYSFTDLPAGTYHVREEQQFGWTQTTPPLDVTLVVGQTFAGGDIGNYREASISGIKFNDYNGDGVNSPGEVGIPGWTIFLDANGNDQLDPGETSTTTDTFGAYTFDPLPAGTYVVREVQQPGWTQTSTNPAPIVILPNLTTQTPRADFGNRQTDVVTTISGRKFFDLDSDGVAEPGEPGLRFWPIYLDTNGDDSYQSDEPITWTDPLGDYSFTGVAPGTYRVREIQQAGWTQTTAEPGDIIVTTVGQAFANVDFGNRSSNGNPTPGNDPPTDLEIVKGALRAVAGEQITYTLTVTNRGPADSYGVILGDQLKPGLVYESATPSQGTCLGGQTIICAVGALAVGESASVTIVAHVESWVVDEIINEGCVYSTSTDTDTTNNCSIAHTPIDVHTDLELVKTADGIKAIAGQDLTYTLRVKNNGPSDSTNVQLEDELPPEVSFVSVLTTHGSCSLEVTSVQTVICDLGTVVAGDTAVVTLVVHVGPWVPEDAIITNTGSVRDRYGSGGTGVVRIPCGRSTDFELNKTGPFTTVDAQVYYVIEVTNHGPSNSAGPIVGDNLPDEINFLYAVPSQGVCNQADPLVCNLGPMLVGQTETVTVFVGVPETVIIENIRNEAVVQPPEGDPDPWNNWDGTGGVIPPQYGLGITKEAPPEIPAGEYLHYTLHVTNEGPDDASNVIVGDTIPAGLIFVSATPTQGTCNAYFNPILCFLGPMEAGDEADVEIVVFVPPTIPEGTEIFNRAWGWGGVPPVFGDARTRVIRRADVSLEKEAPPDVVAGTEMTYTLRARNRGPSDSTNITLEDELPPEVNFVSATPSQGTCTNTEDNGHTTVSCELGDIPANSVATVEVVVFVPSYIIPGTVIANGACLPDYTFDPNLANNCGYVETRVGDESEVGLIKVSTPGPITAGEDIEYTLEAYNLGPSDARQFILGDTLPAPLVFVSATSTQGTCDYVNGVVICDIGYLAAGQHEFVTIVAYVPPSTPDGTVIENTACITDCGHDILHDNDCSTVRNTVRAQSVLTGVKFNDLNGNGERDINEPGIEGWQIFLDLDGDNVLDANERSTFTDVNGVYTITGLGKTTWNVREVQNPGWLQTTANPPGVTVTGLQQTYAGGDFGNKQGSIAGRVFIDSDNDGIFDPGEIGIGGVAITLVGNDDLGAVNRTTFTGSDGFYSFGSLRPGSYRVIESQPPGYLDGQEHLGDIGGTVGNDEFFLDLGRGEDGSDYGFAELEPAKLSGYVYNDTNDNGQIDFGEQAITGAQLTLTGTNDLNEVINQIVTTDTQGYYEFYDLRPGSYTLSETQPNGYGDGKDTIGSLGGTVSNDQFSAIVAVSGSNGINYNYGEHVEQALVPGMTATIGFWQNKNGQALITGLNGGANSTSLGNWLATSFPNMYGAGAGVNNLTGKTNSQIAAYYVTLFKQKGQKLDAQVMGLAFATYVTNNSLAGNNATAYGFLVSTSGTGAAVYNVGSSGAAFDVPDGTVLTVMQILTATNDKSIAGRIYDGITFLRNLANTVYDAINQGGDI